MTNILGLMQYVQQQGDKGTDTRKRNALAQLAGDYASTGNVDYGAVAANGGDPLRFRDDARKQDDLLRESLGRDAAMLLATKDPAMRAAMYQQNLPKYQHFFQAAPATYSEQLDPILEQLASNAGGGGRVQSSYVDGNGDRIAVMRDGSTKNLGPAAANLRPLATENGYDAFDPRTGGARPVVEGGAMPAAAPETAPAPASAPGAPDAALDAPLSAMQLASVFQHFGGTVTSGLRTPEHNAKVGGVSNSQHMAGTALDVVFPPAIKAQAVAFGKSHGYEVIEEGDHVHFELPPGAAPTTGSRVKPPPKASADAAPSGYQWNADHSALNPIPGGPADTGGAYELSPDAISNSAWDFILTGTKPQFARSHEGDKQRIAIQNEVAKIAHDAGVSPAELATQKGQYKALQSSMSNLQKQSDVIDKASETFHRNADYMLELSGKVPRYDAQVLNKYLLDFRLKWSGDPATAAYIAAARTAINEYAKIASGATGAAGSTDTARREAEDAISAAQSSQQLAAVIETLKRDAANQQNATHEQLTAIAGRMQQFGKSPPASGSTAGWSIKAKP